MFCNDKLEGRVDKLFCTPSCKSSYHYQRNKEKTASFYKKVDTQLKMNRRLLKLYNRAGKATVRKDTMIGEGFDPRFFTHYWKNQRGDVYLFCYEFGFLSKKENNYAKYILIQWQDYMN